MTKESNTTTAPFLKELDPELHRFLRLVDRLESEMVRMDVAVADLKSVTMRSSAVLKQP